MAPLKWRTNGTDFIGPHDFRSEVQKNIYMESEYWKVLGNRSKILQSWEDYKLADFSPSDKVDHKVQGVLATRDL